jgi:hypothetical protein
MNTRIVKVIIYFRQKAILFNHSITKLISFPKMLKKRPFSGLNAFMNWGPEGLEPQI